MRPTLPSSPVTIEPIESRQLLSVTLLSDGALQILGTPGDDTITVQMANRVIGVSDDGVNTDFPASSVKAVHIHAYQGNDVIGISHLQRRVNIFDGNGDNQISSDVFAKVSVGGGSDTVAFNFTVDGENQDLGYDTIYARGTLDATSGGGDNVIVGGSGNDTIATVGGYNTITGGSGDDAITCNGGHDSIGGGPGNDMIFVHGRHSTIHGGQGNDSIQIDANVGGFDLIGLGAGNDTASVQSQDTVYTGTGADSITGTEDIFSGDPPGVTG